MNDNRYAGVETIAIRNTTPLEYQIELKSIRKSESRGLIMKLKNPGSHNARRPGLMMAFKKPADRQYGGK